MLVLAPNTHSARSNKRRLQAPTLRETCQTAPSDWAAFEIWGGAGIIVIMYSAQYGNHVRRCCAKGDSPVQCPSGFPALHTVCQRLAPDHCTGMTFFFGESLKNFRVGQVMCEWCVRVCHTLSRSTALLVGQGDGDLAGSATWKKKKKPRTSAVNRASCVSQVGPAAPAAKKRHPEIPRLHRHRRRAIGSHACSMGRTSIPGPTLVSMLRGTRTPHACPRCKSAPFQTATLHSHCARVSGPASVGRWTRRLFPVWKHCTRSGNLKWKISGIEVPRMGSVCHAVPGRNERSVLASRTTREDADGGARGTALSLGKQPSQVPCSST